MTIRYERASSNTLVKVSRVIKTRSSVGNAALIDTIDTPIPVYFFYKDITTSGWQYQGIVDVQDFQWGEQDGRQVLVFEMEYVEKEKRGHPGLYLVPVSDEWIPDFERTVAG